jgi:hypothetical protein
MFKLYTFIRLNRGFTEGALPTERDARPYPFVCIPLSFRSAGLSPKESAVVLLEADFSPFGSE